MKSRRQPPAPAKTPAMVGPAWGACSPPEERTEESIWPKAPRSALPVHDEGRRPEVMQRLMARSSGVMGFRPVTTA